MKVFISYCTEDDKKRRALSNALQSATPSFTPVVVAARSEPGKPLADKVIACINEADVLVPILTRASISNQWVNQEIGYARGIERTMVPLVERGVVGALKGFIHDQNDLPFTFTASPDEPRREAAAFRTSYRLLIAYLQAQRDRTLQSSLSPTRVRQGDDYTTTVSFRGSVLNGFFDNYVEHLGSNFYTFNWDPETIPGVSPLDTTPGILNGSIDITKSYRHSTKGWPLGRYRIYVRLYSHPVPGDTGRSVVAENVHDFEVI